MSLSVGSNSNASSSNPIISNLQCFLDSVTPTAHIQLSKSYVHALRRSRHAFGKAMDKCFSLGDLWNSYDEWSAYGVDAPIVLNTGESVVQYYAPSLSAIQIYTSQSFASLREMEKNCMEKVESEPSSNESESDKMSRSLSNNSSKTTSEDSTIDEEGSLQKMNQFGYLYLHFNETTSPYDRVPLSDKINELAKTYPGLMKFRSAELSPYSWMAIAWYPIYHIPATRNVKELSACFLTYHKFAPSFHGLTNSIMEKDEKGKSSSSLVAAGFGSRRRKVKREQGEKICLPPFAMATYKMYGTLWMNPDTLDQETIVCRQNDAYSWLLDLRFQHHDFNFFISRSNV